MKRRWLVEAVAFDGTVVHTRRFRTSRGATGYVARLTAPITSDLPLLTWLVSRPTSWANIETETER